MRYALIAVLVFSIGGTAPATAAEQDPGPITNALTLQVVEESQYVKPGEPILVTLEQFGLEEAVMGYQAFTAFDPGAIAFDSGYYMSVPYDYWIIDPITASGGNIDLAAGAVVLVVEDAELVELAFTAGMAECVTQIVFRPHDPPSIFTDDAGYEVTPTLLDSPDIYIDGTPPVITCPPDLLDQPNDPGVCEAVLDVGTATAADNLSGVDTIQGTRSDGLALSAAYPVGTTTITWTAVDKSGNQSECVQTVTVVDVEDPSITAPEDLIVSNDAGFCYATGVSLGTPDVDDNCGIEAGFPTNDAPAQFVVGQTVVTWTVQDIHGNQATDTQLVTVLDSEDPTITCPPDITVYCPAGVTSKTIDPGTATAHDNCGVQSVVGTRSDGLPLGDPYPIGTTVIT